MYAIVIGTAILLAEGATLTVHFVVGSVSLAYAICAPLFLAVFCGLLLGVLDILIRLMPQNVWRYDKKPLLVSKKEVKFYEKLGIKKWKDKAVPDLGASAGFSKKNLKSTELEYLERFLRETCQGEALHLSGALLAFCFLALYPISDWYFVAPMLAVNFFINILPCMIQRYNRYRLSVVYKFKARHAALATREEKATLNVEEAGGVLSACGDAPQNGAGVRDQTEEEEI